MRTKIERETDLWFPEYEIEDDWNTPFPLPYPSFDDGSVFYYTDKNGKKHRFSIQ